MTGVTSPVSRGPLRPPWAGPLKVPVRYPGRSSVLHRAPAGLKLALLVGVRPRRVVVARGPASRRSVALGIVLGHAPAGGRPGPAAPHHPRAGADPGHRPPLIGAYQLVGPRMADRGRGGRRPGRRSCSPVRSSRPRPAPTSCSTCSPGSSARCGTSGWPPSCSRSPSACSCARSRCSPAPPQETRDAARARGLERNPRAVLIPAAVRMVAHARATGDALAARGPRRDRRDRASSRLPYSSEATPATTGAASCRCERLSALEDYVAGMTFQEGGSFDGGRVQEARTRQGRRRGRCTAASGASQYVALLLIRAGLTGHSDAPNVVNQVAGGAGGGGQQADPPSARARAAQAAIHRPRVHGSAPRSRRSTPTGRPRCRRASSRASSRSSRRRRPAAGTPRRSPRGHSTARRTRRSTSTSVSTTTWRSQHGASGRPARRGVRDRPRVRPPHPTAHGRHGQGEPTGHRRRLRLGAHRAAGRLLRGHPGPRRRAPGRSDSGHGQARTCSRSRWPSCRNALGAASAVGDDHIQETVGRRS